MQRPRGKASPVDSNADKKVAKVITGLGRHVEVNSDADNAYDTAFDFAARIGWGYWRLRTDYIAEDSDKQDVYIDVINNPFTVYFDPNSKLPDGSDAERVLVTDVMPKKLFEKEYPGAIVGDFNDRGAGDSDPNWVMENDIRLAEYMFVDRKPAKLVYLTDGTAVWADKLPMLQRIMAGAGIGVRGDRDSFKRVVKWRKQTGYEVLEEKDLPGRWVPIVPVYWTNTVIDGKNMKCGLTQGAMDPQIIINFMHTSVIESLAQATKAKWLLAEGQDEGHENEFKNANLSAAAVLRYKPTDVEGKPVPPPTRIQPEPPPSGFIEGAFLASQNLTRVMGVFDPAVRGGAQHKSDKTLNAEQGQSETSNFEGFDNLTRSIKHTWRIMLSYFPVVYDTQRVQRIIGDDGRDELVTLNERTQKQDGTGQAIDAVLNDMTVGTYDVIMDTGPGYETARKEGVASTMELMATPVGEKVAAVADDLIVRQMDFQGADEIADRLAAANPLSQIDEKSDVPPQAQMRIKSMEQQIQQLTQQLQAAGVEIKFGLKKEQMKQEGATQRTHLTAVAKAHDTETWAQEETAQVQSVERTKEAEMRLKRQTALDVEEIKGHIALLLARISERSADNSSDEATERAV